jgi:hypothetical protein
MDEGLFSGNGEDEVLALLPVLVPAARDTWMVDDVVATLVEVHGVEETLRLLATVLMRRASWSLATAATAEAVVGLPSWEQRRCPVCHEVCRSCVEAVVDSLDGR